MRKEVRGRRWHTGDSSRRASMPGNLGFSRLKDGEGVGVTDGFSVPRTARIHDPSHHLGFSGAFSAHPSCLWRLDLTSSSTERPVQDLLPSQVTLPHPVLCTLSCLRPPSYPPSFPPPRLLPRPSEPPALQQALVGALLVGLVGDVGQVDSAEGWAVAQHNVAHAEAQDIGL